MSRFDPVYLSKPLDKRVSQTALRHMARCPRSAYLYFENRGEAQNDAMVRGSAAHAIFERATKLAIENHEPMVPPELVRDVLAEVLAEFPVPWHEQDLLREMTWRWATEWTIDPAQVVACETLYVLEVGGWEVRAKVDFAEMRGDVLYVADYKTGRGASPLDEVARKRKDKKTLLPRSFQLALYALAIKYGKPVRLGPEYECVGCGRGPDRWQRVVAEGGSPGVLETEIEDDEIEDGCCGHCKGRLRAVEHVEDSRGARAQGVIAHFVYPSIENAESKMLRRPMDFSSLEMTENLESLRALVGQLAEAERTGEWEAIVSTPGCGECPAKSLCPIPPHLRDHEGEIESIEQAALLLEALDIQSKEAAAIRRSIKAFAKRNDVEIPFGVDKVAKFVYSKTERINRDAVLEACRTGRPLLRDAVISESESTLFKDVKLAEEELRAEAENTD